MNGVVNPINGPHPSGVEPDAAPPGYAPAARFSGPDRTITGFTMFVAYVEVIVVGVSADPASVRLNFGIVIAPVGKFAEALFRSRS